MKRGIPFLLGLLSLSACKSNVVTEQGLLVTVQNPSSIAGIVKLSVSLSNGGTSDTLTFPITAQTTPFTATSFSVSVPATRTGRVDIAISGLNESGAMVANGTAFAVLQAGTFVPVPLQLGATSGAGGSDGAVDTDGTDGGGGLASGVDLAEADAPTSMGGTGGAGGMGGFGGYGVTGGSIGSIGTGGSIGSGGAMSTGGNQSTGDTTDSGFGCLIGATAYSSGEANPTNACQSCQPGTSPSAWSNLADGLACGAGEICHTGTCASGCGIGGVFSAAGAAGANPCQTCQPGISTTAWSPLADGTSCGQGQVCASGACGSQCDIGTKVYATATANPTNSCQSCQPGTSTTAWSTVADGTACTGGICHTGVCGNGCEISGAYYASGTGNPSNACQSCQPATSRLAWTNLPNGTTCAVGAVCDVGSCLADCYIGGTFYTPGKVSSTNACQSCEPTTSTSAWTTASGLSCSGSCVNGQTSTSNCGACGHSCSSGGASATSCSSGSCAPTCLAGHQDCSTPGSSSADDGCECAGTGCCGTSCQTAHSNGFGQTFHDCSPLNTYTVTSAVEACTALTGDAALCQSCATTNAVSVAVNGRDYSWTFMSWQLCIFGCTNYYAGQTISCTNSGSSVCDIGGTDSNCSTVLNAWN